MKLYSAIICSWVTGEYVIRVDVERLDLSSAEEVDRQSLVDVAAVQLAVGLEVRAGDEAQEHDHIVRLLVVLEHGQSVYASATGCRGRSSGPSTF